MTFNRPRLTFDPREVDEYVRKLDQRRELVYRIAIRSLCDRCRGDREFQLRTKQLLKRYRHEDIGAVLAEADRLAKDLTGGRAL